jgi:hypothetical protein
MRASIFLSVREKRNWGKQSPGLPSSIQTFEELHVFERMGAAAAAAAAWVLLMRRLLCCVLQNSTHAAIFLW